MPSHLGLSFFLLLSLTAMAVDPASKLVSVSPSGKLSYTAYDEQGDKIPDFSSCGYGGGGARIPSIPVKETLSPAPGNTDDTSRIQAALDSVAQLPTEADGFRGAVLLRRGHYRCGSSIKIAASGIVLRGEGEGENDTVLTATANQQYSLVEIGGPGRPRETAETKVEITDKYIPVGSRSFTVANAKEFAPGQTVFVIRRSNAAWIHEIAMDRIVPRPGHPEETKQWSPFELPFDRTIIAVEGNRITVDVPILCAIDEHWGGGALVRYDDSSRTQKCGVENLRAVSAYDPAKTAEYRGEKVFTDEAHALYLARFGNAKNCWARNLTSVSFYHGVATLTETSKWVTVTDCSALDPVSEITGGRRYAFDIAGQQDLVQRCRTRGARHAFVFSARVPGPNVFRDCRSEKDYATSEPHHRWSVGGLYDDVRAEMAFQDRQWMGSGHGWAGANYVAWNCEGSLVCQQPPTAQNFAIGFIGKKENGAFPRPMGWWESEGRHVSPHSLYLAQLLDRLGPTAVQNAEDK